MSKRRGSETTIGDGEAPNYPALLLFLSGMACGGIATYCAVNRGGYALPLAAALLLMLTACAVVAVEKRGKK